MQQIKNLAKQIVPSSVKTLIKKGRYFGNSFYDPICNTPLRLLHPNGEDHPTLKEAQIVSGGYRQNSMCPVCRSRERHRLIYLYLQHHTTFFHQPQKFLYVAPAPCLHTAFQQLHHLDYISGDIDTDEREAEFDLDVTQINYPDNTFDIILCNHVLEHVPDDRRAMRELRRVLKPDGLAILQVPFSPIRAETFEDFSITSEEDRYRVFGQKDHVRIYGLDYMDRLQESGFVLDLFKWWEDDTLQEVNQGNKHGLLGNEPLFVVRKN